MARRHLKVDTLKDLEESFAKLREELTDEEFKGYAPLYNSCKNRLEKSNMEKNIKHPKYKRIEQLRNEYHAFSSQTDVFTKRYKRIAESEGIDWFLIQCEQVDFDTVIRSGNLNEFLK